MHELDFDSFDEGFFLSPEVELFDAVHVAIEFMVIDDVNDVLQSAMLDFWERVADKRQKARFYYLMNFLLYFRLQLAVLDEDFGYGKHQGNVLAVNQCFQL